MGLFLNLSVKNAEDDLPRNKTWKTTFLIFIKKQFGKIKYKLIIFYCSARKIITNNYYYCCYYLPYRDNYFFKIHIFAILTHFRFYSLRTFLFSLKCKRIDVLNEKLRVEEINCKWQHWHVYRHQCEWKYFRRGKIQFCHSFDKRMFRHEKRI